MEAVVATASISASAFPAVLEKLFHLEAVLAYRPFVGSIHDQVPDLEIQLKAAGVAIVWVEREWDTTWFPYAKKGFFPFWKSAGQQLQARQISLTS